MSEYAKNIQTIEDMWKKRIELREEGYERMSEYIIWESDGIEVQGHRVTQYEKREEIVRCCDCKHYNNQEPGGEIGTCNLGLEDLDLYSIVEPNGFCAWGARRDGDAR